MKPTIEERKKARDLSYEEYREHLERSRNRRLVQAIEHESARQKKNKAMLSKFAKQWDGLDTRIVNKIAKITADLDAVDEMLYKFAELNNKITLTEE